MYSNPLSRILLTASLVLCWLLCTTTAHAARLALVVGNDQYQSISKLRNAVADAQTMGESFRKAGYQVTVVTNVDLRVLKDELRAFRRRVRGGDEVVLYFSGHGVQLGAENFLLPVDVRSDTEEQVRDDGLALSAVLADLRTAKPGFTLAIIDACRDNPFEKAGKSIGGRGLGRPPSATGEMVLFAAGEGQQALDRLSATDPVRNGLFTRVFVNEMQRPGLSIDQTLRNVRVEVNRLAQTVKHEQVPALYDQVLGTYYFYPPGARDPSEIEQQAWDAAKAANSEAGYRAYLSEYPQGRFASAARVAIASVRPTPPVQIASVVPEPVPQPVPQPAPAPVAQAPQPGSLIKDCANCPELVVIPAGRFTMGSSAAEQALANAAGLGKNLTDRESPQHVVSVRSFAAGKYAVTKGEFAAFVRAKGYQTEAEAGDGCFGWTGTEWKKDKAYNWRNVGFAQGNDHPVVCVSYNDTQAYIQWLNQTSGKTFRLLSEAEREYATRAGTQTAFWWGDSINTSQANYGGTGTPYNGGTTGQFRQATVPVSSFNANPFGLHNVHGNVFEWVEDCFHDTYSGAPTDGSAWTSSCSGNFRVLRGGSWSDYPAGLRSANRDGGTPVIRINSNGFRVARTLLTP